MNTEDKDQNAKTVAEFIFVSTTREDHDVRIVGGWGVEFAGTTGKDQNAKTVVEVRFVSTTR